MERLFVSVRPPPGARGGIETIGRPSLPEVRWVPAQQWHVTLAFLGRCEMDVVLRALSGASLPGCEAVLGPHVAWLGDRVLMVPVGGLDELAAAVRAPLDPLCAEPLDRPFRGHLTLGRLRKGVRRGRSRRGAPTDSGPLGRVVGRPVSARWRPEAVELVSSVTRPEGAVHEVVATVPLPG